MAITRHQGGAFVTDSKAATVEGQFQISTVNVITTTLTANTTASTLGALTGSDTGYFEMIVTAGAFTFDLPAAWDPDSRYEQPTADPFIVAIRILPGGAVRFVGVA